MPHTTQAYPNRSLTSAELDWHCHAIARINADYQRSADTHLLKLQLPCFQGSTLYLKDESIHPSGSLKHRLARSLFLFGLANGSIKQNTTIIEASSGNTAISEAYFAQLLGLPFIAVIPEKTAQEKIKKIEFYGGKTHKVPPHNIYDEAAKLAKDLKGHYMDQFTYAERATDWRGSNNIAERLFEQMQLEPNPRLDWIVMSAGTGGTSATLGRYIRYQPNLYKHTRLCVVDPEHSVYADYFTTGKKDLSSKYSSQIEGIGQPRPQPSFITSVIDTMLKIPDAASIATIHWLESILDRKVGGSTGTNVYGALRYIARASQESKPINVATVICDPGSRYLDTFYSPDWLKSHRIDLQPYLDQLNNFEQTGQLEPVST
ncbi:Cysteine synthase B [Poriferisphaera corsica]|uniref:cystathionine gamma-lyase n=1 Tax=Poriferisphaera corsica TaxID=2528020 RepID=A0A517YY01_9BACT|nr:PLP-dependent cysteine synthase family protein [Poriferisphaera corsica]QDU35086.1 Cysteine synthase B [Poriferisphaera corsica]